MSVGADETLRPLQWWRIAQALRGQRVGRRVVYRETVDSTMDFCHALARAGAVAGTVVVADAQTAGRGRQGRVWLAPPRTCLLFSLLLRPALPPAQWPHVLWPLAVALQAALRQEADVCTAIKWPNDLVVRGRKVGGLLAETTRRGIVVGAGVNVNFSAAAIDVEQPLTTVADEANGPVAREALLVACLQSFEQWYAQWQAAPDDVWRAWRAGAYLMGETVRVVVGGAAYQGLVVDHDRDGCLCLRLGDGEVRRFAAGEASVRLAPAE